MFPITFPRCYNHRRAKFTWEMVWRSQRGTIPFPSFTWPQDARVGKDQDLVTKQEGKHSFSGQWKNWYSLKFLFQLLIHFYIQYFSVGLVKLIQSLLQPFQTLECTLQNMDIGSICITVVTTRKTVHFLNFASDLGRLCKSIWKYDVNRQIQGFTRESLRGLQWEKE